MNILLETKGISKSFGNVRALYKVDFKVPSNKIVALLGDNGAGKSTLAKIIAGVIQPDEGEIYFEGEKVNITNPRDAIKLGIEIVYQDLGLCDNLDITSNFFLGREIIRSYFNSLLNILSKKEMVEKANTHLKSLDIEIKSLNERVRNLSGGQRQAVAVARAIAWGTKLVILDEPTAALGVKEAAKVLKLIRDLKEKGLTIIIITHNLEHVFLVCDYIVVLRKGEKVYEVETALTNPDNVVKMITGAEFGRIESSQFQN